MLTTLPAFEKIPPHLRKNLSAKAQQDLSTFPDDWPEIEYVPVAMTFFPMTEQAMTVTMAGVAPLSRGSVTISSSSAPDPPLIDPNWLGHPTDQEVCIQGFKRARELAAASGLVAGPEIYPGEAVQSDEAILEFLKQSTTTIHHGSGTCKMGMVEDEMTVVDSKCRVVGVEGLRVVDASAFPFAPPGHGQATVYMLAEKIADDVLKGL